MLASPGRSIDLVLCRAIRFESNTQTQTKDYATSGLASLSGSHCPTNSLGAQASCLPLLAVRHKAVRDACVPREFVEHQEELI